MRGVGEEIMASVYGFAVVHNGNFYADGHAFVWIKKRDAAARAKFYETGKVVRVKVATVGRKKRK